MNKRLIGLLTVLVMGWAPLASGERSGSAGALSAEQEAAFQAIVAQAMEHYQARRYTQAIELFMRAHEIRTEPELVYNIARSYERLAQLDEAVEYYERFLSLPATTAELRSRARANLTALRQEQASLDASQQPPQTPPPGPGDGTGPDGGEVEEGRQPLATAGWVLFGVGAATAIAGVVFAGLTISSDTQFQEADVNDDRISLRDDIERNALAADVLLITGGTVGLTGIVLLIVNAVRARRGDEPDVVDLAVHPLTLDGGLGLGVRGRF